MDNKLYNSKTFKNLINAFAGECQASSRYRQLADVAYEQKLNELAKFITMISTNEYYHSRRMYEFIRSATDKPIDGLVVNSNFPFKESKEDFVEAFRLAATNETEEATKIYPSFAKIARDEGFDEIATFFDNIVQVENCHKMALTELYGHLTDGTLYSRSEAIKWKCANCGYESTLKKAWKKCPICGSPQGDIMLELSE